MSSKQSDEPSLKDLLYAGTCLLPKLGEILLRFRCGKIPHIADIKQAFLQSEVNHSHRDFLRFLWYDSITADNPNIVAFCFTRILFGLNSSPFILERTLQMHMSKYDFTYHKIYLVQKFIHDFVGNRAKRRISKRVSQKNKTSQIFRKTNISYPLIRTHTRVRIRG